MLASTTLRLENSILEKITQIANQRHLDRGTFMRQLIMKGYEEELLEANIEDYKKGKITIGELAQNTNKNLWEIAEILKSRKIASLLTLKDAAG